jgi:hypothetical protein
VRRVLALLAAVAMIAGAVVVRQRLDEGALGQPLTAEGRPTTVLCDLALEAVCRALTADAELTVAVEEAGASLERLWGLPDAVSGGVPEGVPDVWVTLAPWPAMVDEERGRRGLQPLFDAASAQVALGSSPLVLLAWEDRADVLRASCGEEVLTWRCVAPVAGQPWVSLGGDATWGPVKPGLDDPARSSLGLTVLAQATAEEVQRADFGRGSLQDGAYQDWLAALGRSVRDFSPPAGLLAEMVLTGPAKYDVAASTEAFASPVLAGDRAADVGVHYAEPLVTADAVAAVRGGVEADRVRAVAERALAEAGWHTATAGPPSLGDAEVDTTALPTNPPGSTQPSPGAMTALRSTFLEVVRP